jgi:branched-chain amino acid transport system ATP-binding protein
MIESVPIIKVRNLSKAFGALRAVDNLTFEAARHRITSIIGPNGAGKSSAFNLIAGTLRPDSGTVELDGRDTTGSAPYALARLGVARSFQITNLFFGLSVLENVRLACQSLEPRRRYLVRLNRLSEPLRRAQDLLAELDLADHAGELVGNLSHGDQRRVEIALCMALAPKLLMLDEPTQGMSPAETAEVDALIKRLAGRVTVLLIEHDIELVMSLSDHVVVMHQGQKLFEGTPQQVRASPLVREAYLGVDHAAA